MEIFRVHVVFIQKSVVSVLGIYQNGQNTSFLNVHNKTF